MSGQVWRRRRGGGDGGCVLVRRWLHHVSEGDNVILVVAVVAVMV